MSRRIARDGLTWLVIAVALAFFLLPVVWILLMLLLTLEWAGRRVIKLS